MEGIIIINYNKAMANTTKKKVTVKVPHSETLFLEKLKGMTHSSVFPALELLVTRISELEKEIKTLKSK